MLKKILFFSLILFFVVSLTGCTVRTYKMTKDRVDQDLSVGNKGYLKGNAPAVSANRKTTRDIQAVEVELGFPANTKKSKTCAVQKPCAKEKVSVEKIEIPVAEPIVEPIQKGVQEYIVQKGDTLQKISQKFYGTTKKWSKIFEFNKSALKAPDKIYPGQTLKIPLE